MIARDPIVAFPGTLCDSRMFGPLADRLGQRVLPGDTSRALDAATLADAALAAAPERFVGLGFSLGGFVALEVALRAPDRLSGLILIGSNARADRPENEAIRKAQWRLAAKDGFEALLRDLWPNYVAEGNRADGALFIQLVEMAEAVGLDAFARQIEVATSRRDQRRSLASIAMPALVIRGQEDALFTVEMQSEMAAGLPRGASATVPAAGHFAPLEAPGATAEAIRAWFAAGEAGE